MTTRVFQLASGIAVAVRMEGETLTISADGDCEIRLAREDAWQLAEALDDLASRAPGTEEPAADNQD